MTKVKMLIVDDYLDNRLLLKQIADILNYQFVMAENGQQALNLLNDQPDINIIFMDIEMPIMNGIEATRELRKFYPPKGDIPVIAITAHTSEHFSEKLNDSGFNGFIAKPYTMDKIMNAVRQNLHL